MGPQRKQTLPSPRLAYTAGRLCVEFALTNIAGEPATGVAPVVSTKTTVRFAGPLRSEIVRMATKFAAAAGGPPKTMKWRLPDGGFVKNSVDPPLVTEMPGNPPPTVLTTCVPLGVLTVWLPVCHAGPVGSSRPLTNVRQGSGIGCLPCGCASAHGSGGVAAVDTRYGRRSPLRTTVLVITRVAMHRAAECFGGSRPSRKREAPR